MSNRGEAINAGLEYAQEARERGDMEDALYHLQKTQIATLLDIRDALHSIEDNVARASGIGW